MRALISVSDKTGVVDFAKGLRALGWEVIATGGTMKLLADSGVEVINISDVTGFPEICDGRVKTLHPNVHGGLLARRDDPEHLKALKENKIEFIDMVCVNLYPFRETISKPGVKMEDAIENIDIGGPSMLRSAAKNWADVTVVCDPADYAQILDEIRAGGNTGKATRLKLSAKAYTHTAEYDSMIATYMRAQAGLNEKLFLEFDLVQSLRYGENPHQSAAFYRRDDYADAPHSLAHAKQHQGKELSYNNYLDLDAAWTAVREFDEPACVIVKHLTPCGVCQNDDLVEAYQRAHACDPVSAYGGVMAFNRPVTSDVVVAIFDNKQFVEAIIAPEFAGDALDMYSAKKNARLLSTGGVNPAGGEVEYRSVEGGLLAQDSDAVAEDPATFTVPTKRQPSEEELAELLFAWKVCKSIKSNAIAITKGHATIGVGGGQPNRVNSARIAVEQAGEEAKGAVAASDAFFPFRDGLDALAEAGVTAIIEPGGSIRDEEVIAAADEHGIALVFTGHRHFRH